MAKKELKPAPAKKAEVKKAAAKKAEVKKESPVKKEYEEAHKRNLNKVKNAIITKSFFELIDGITNSKEAIELLTILSEYAKEKIETNTNLSIKPSIDSLYSLIKNSHIEISNNKNNVDDLKDYLCKAHLAFTRITNFID